MCFGLDMDRTAFCTANTNLCSQRVPSRDQNGNIWGYLAGRMQIYHFLVIGIRYQYDLVPILTHIPLWGVSFICIQMSMRLVYEGGGCIHQSTEFSAQGSSVVMNQLFLHKTYLMSQPTVPCASSPVQHCCTLLPSPADGALELLFVSCLVIEEQRTLNRSSLKYRNS